MTQHFNLDSKSGKREESDVVLQMSERLTQKLEKGHA